MKTNSIPVDERLSNRISKLWASIRFGDYWSNRKYYPRCMYCGITNVQCSIRNGRHNKGCIVNGILKEIAHYKSLLPAPAEPTKGRK